MGEFERGPLGRVTVYSIQGCPHCVQAKATLGRLEVPVCDVDIGRHPELRARVKELTGRSTVPQIFFNSVHVGGNDDLQKLVRRSITSKKQYRNPHWCLGLCLSDSFTPTGGWWASEAGESGQGGAPSCRCTTTSRRRPIGEHVWRDGWWWENLSASPNTSEEDLSNPQINV